MQTKLSAVATAVLTLWVATGSQATVITSPDTFRADFDFSGEALLPLDRIDAYFSVSSALDALTAGESFDFSLFDDESTLLATNTLTASGPVGFFGRTFFFGAGELTDGIGFVTVTGNVGSFAIASAWVEGRQSPLPGFATRSVSYSAYTPVPEPSAALLAATGLLGLAVRARTSSHDRRGNHDAR